MPLILIILHYSEPRQFQVQVVQFKWLLKVYWCFEAEACIRAPKGAQCIPFGKGLARTLHTRYDSDRKERVSLRV